MKSRLTKTSILLLGLMCSLGAIMSYSDSILTNAIESLSGSGTEFDPYLISNLDELNFLAINVNNGNEQTENKYYKLTSDIGDSSSPFRNSIGIDYPFKGIFDGAGHTIYLNQSFECPREAGIGDYDFRAGLFSKVIGSTIKNVNVDGRIFSNTKGSSFVGGICGYIASGGDTNIINCHSNASISAYSSCGSRAGGIVGESAGGNFTTNIINCSSSTPNGTIHGTNYLGDLDKADHEIGGIIGYSSSRYTVIKNCYSDAKLNISSPFCFTFVGGIYGFVTSLGDVSFELSNSYFDGTLKNSPMEHLYRGAIGGNEYTNFSFDKCYHCDYDAIGRADLQPSHKDIIKINSEDITKSHDEENALVDMLNVNMKDDLDCLPWKNDPTSNRPVHKKDFVVTFDKQDGSEVIDFINVTYGCDMSDSIIPTKTGVIFGGFFDSISDGNQYFDTNGKSLKTFDKTRDTILYARWNRNALDSYSIKFLELTDSYCSNDTSFISELQSSFALLSNEDKATFKNAEVIIGYVEKYPSEVVEAKSRYFVMVTYRNYDDFLNLGVSPINRGVFGLLNSDNSDNSSSVLIICFSILAISTFAICFVYKRHKKVK